MYIEKNIHQFDNAMREKLNENEAQLLLDVLTALAVHKNIYIFSGAEIPRMVSPFERIILVA